MYINPIAFVGQGNPTFGNSSAKASFAFADEWFKVGGRQIRRQRQILPLPTNSSRSGVGKFVGKGKFCLCRRMVQGRGSANSSAKANFAFADEWSKVGGRQIRRQRQILPLPTNGSRSGVGKFVGKGKFCLCRRMVQGRGSANSSAKANFAFADEWFKVGGRQIRRQRQILPLPTNGPRSGVGDEWFQAEGSREGRGSA